MPCVSPLLRETSVPKHLLEEDGEWDDCCPECGDGYDTTRSSWEGFFPFERGEYQRDMLAWRVGPLRPFCAVVCPTCKHQLGWELPEGALPYLKAQAARKRVRRLVEGIRVVTLWALALAGVVALLRLGG